MDNWMDTKIIDTKKRNLNELIRSIVKALAIGGISIYDQCLGLGFSGALAFDSTVKEATQKKLIESLEKKVGDIKEFFSDEWFKSDAGKLFAVKVLTSAMDGQLSEKSQFFVNALISGVRSKDIDDLQKFKFIDLLRSLSRVALEVLSVLHTEYEPKTIRPGRADPGKSTVLMDEKVIDSLVEKGLDPYNADSGFQELKSAGIFSYKKGWIRNSSGKSIPKGGYSNALSYTDFTCRFVEFIKGD